MSVEIDLSNAGIPGLPKSLVIANAAQDETLQEILKVLKSSNKALNTLTRSNGGGGGGGGGGINSLGGGGGGGGGNGPANSIPNLFGKSGKAAGSLAASFGKLAGGTLNVAMAAVKAAELLAELGLQSLEVAKSLSTVSDSMVNAANSLDKIPVVGAFLAQFLGAAAESAERLYGEFTALSAVGVTFSGSMTSMVNAASGAGLTIEQFNNVLKNSGSMLASLGGTTEEGAKRFAQLSKSMKTGGIASELYKMGYTTEQVNSGMLSYIGSISSADKLSAMSTDQLVKGSAKYLKEINMLASITGESREAKQKEMEQIATNVQFQAAINDLSIEDQQDIRAMFALLPGAAKDAAMDMAASANITTENSQHFNNFMPQFSANMRALHQEFKAGKGISLETRSQILDNFILESKVANKQYGSLVEQIRDYDNMFSATQAGQKMQLGALKRYTEDQKNLSAEAGDVEKIAKFKQQIAETGNKFTLALMNMGALETLQVAFATLADFTSNFLLPIINSVFGVMNSLVGSVTTLTPAVDELTESIKKGDGPLSDFYSSIGGSTGVSKILKIFGLTIEGVGKQVDILATPVKILARTLFGGKDLTEGLDNWIEHLYRTIELMDSYNDNISNLIDKAYSFLPKIMNGISKEEAERRIAARRAAGVQRRIDLEKRIQEEKDASAKAAAADKSAKATTREIDARDELTNKLNRKLIDLTSPEKMAKDAITQMNGGQYLGNTTGSIAVTSNMRDYMKKSAILESTIDPNAANKGSSARGLYQFMPDTWTEYVGKMGKNYSLADRFDPVKAAEVMAFFTQSQKNQFEAGVGRSATDTDLYNAHFLGAGGAIQFEKLRAANPNQNAAALFPKEAAQNKATFYNNGRARSLQEVYDLHNAKMAAAGQALITGNYQGRDISSRLPFLNALLPGTSAPTTSPGGLGKRGGSAPLATINQAAANTATSTASAAVANVIPTPAPTPAPTPSTPGTLTTQSSITELLLSLNNKIDSLITTNVSILRSSEEEVRTIRGLGTPPLLVNR